MRGEKYIAQLDFAKYFRKSGVLVKSKVCYA